MFNKTKFSDIQFFSNDETDMLCFPATIAMMLSKLKPEKNLSLKDVALMCDVHPSMSVWPANALLELKAMGLEVVMIESFDAEQFIKNGEAYLKAEFGDETAAWQIKYSDIEKERLNYKKAISNKVEIIHKIPLVQDIRKYLAEGWMVKVTVNSRKLNNKEGYVGHSLLILDTNDNEILVHNPGLPAKKFQSINIADFENAWASPNDAAKEMIALRNYE